MAPAQHLSLTEKDEFVNTSAGWLGVVQFSPEGHARGYSVEPGGSVFLSEEEQMLTANAPRDDSDNPFANGSLALKTRAAQMDQRRPFGPDSVQPFQAPEVPEETGATPEPQDTPPEGSSAPGEEAATPKAAAAMRPRRRG